MLLILFHVLKCFAIQQFRVVLFFFFFNVNSLCSYVTDRQTLVGDSGTLYPYSYTVKFGVPDGSTVGNVKYYHVT